MDYASIQTNHITANFSIAFILFVTEFALLGCGGTNENDASIYAVSSSSEVAAKQNSLIEVQVQSEESDGPKFFQLIKDLGGYDELSKLLATEDDQKIKQTFAKYKINIADWNLESKPLVLPLPI